MKSARTVLASALVLVVFALSLGEASTVLVNDPSNLLWPQPTSHSVNSQKVFSINQNSFSFSIVQPGLSLLQRACERYANIIFSGSLENVSQKETVRARLSSLDKEVQGGISGAVNTLRISISDTSVQTIQLGVDESYSLNITQTTSFLSAKTVFGALRGLETFSQLVYTTEQGEQVTWESFINDSPRFPWRGLLIDSSRHFLTKKVILETIDAMSYAKLNVLHWHMSDGQSIPFDSQVWPDLKKGAYSPKHVYTISDVKDVIAFANDRGVRVVVEFDMPSHAGPAFGIGYPFLTMNCSVYVECKNPNNRYNDHCCDLPFDPTNDQVYDWLQKFIGEISEVFVDDYLHMGGDEVATTCWATSSIRHWMTTHNMTSYNQLEQYFLTKVQAFASSNNKLVVNWEEVFTSNFTTLPQTIIEVWKDFATLDTVAKSGTRALLAYGWYLDHLNLNWIDFYHNEPFDGTLTPAQETFILGGEACMWGETVDSVNIHGRVWPRAAAAAERLWSPKNVTDVSLAFPRFQNLRCRLVSRGIPASPFHPGPEPGCVYSSDLE